MAKQLSIFVNFTQVLPILNNKAKLEGHGSNHNAYFTLFS